MSWVLFVPEFLVQPIRTLRRLPKKGSKRMTFAQIAEALNAQGRVTKHGQSFTAANVGMWSNGRTRETQVVVAEIGTDRNRRLSTT